MSSAIPIINQIALLDNEKLEAQIRVYKIPQKLGRLSMKNKKILKIIFKSIDMLEKEMLDLPKTGIGYIQPKDVLIFESVNGFRNFMTLHKLELLSMIATKKPKSIYELAQMVGRSIAPVQKDCNSLEQSHFIVYKKQIGGRKRF